MGDATNEQPSARRRQLWDMLYSLWTYPVFRKCLSHATGERENCKAKGESKVSCDGELRARSAHVKGLPTRVGTGRQVSNAGASAAARSKVVTEDGEEETSARSAFWLFLNRVGYNSW